MSQYRVWPGNAPANIAIPETGGSVVNVGPGTVYYGGTRYVSDAANFDGSLASGSSVTLYGVTFFYVAQGQSVCDLLVQPVQTAGTSSDVVVTVAAATDGVTDNTTRIDAAITTAQAAGGGVVQLPAGTIVTSGGHVIPPGVRVRGRGKKATTVKHTGNNACFTYGDGASPDGTKAGGGGYFTLTGNSGASAVGIKTADAYGARWDEVVVGSRTGADQYTNGVGWLLRTETYWTEGTVLSGCGALFCATGIRLERSQVAGGQTAPQNSFAYTNFHDCWINVPDAGTGLDFGGPADNYILPYMGQFDVHIWVGVAGAPVSNATGVLVRANAEIPPNSYSTIRVEPKGSGTGNFYIKNLGGKFNPRGGLTRWNDASATENRAAAGSTLVHGAIPALGLDPSAGVPQVVAFDDLWVAKHAGYGVTVKANQEASYTFGYSGSAGAPIHRFAGMGGAVDPTAPFDIDTNTKAWVDTTGAYCLGTVADPRKISRGSAAPESSVTGTRGDVYIRTINTGASLYVKAQGDATNTGWVCISALKGSKTFDWPSIATGSFSTTTVTVTGAALGDFAMASMDAALTAGTWFHAYVTATDTVTVALFNNSGGAVDMASGALSVRVQKN